MNDHDRQNLMFLLNADSNSLSDWFRKSTPDDQDYAWSLLEAYGRELEAQAHELRTEAEIENLNEYYPEALSIINQIQGNLK